MMRSNEDLPAPLAPSTPIFAPWKNESQMPRRISRLGGTTFRRSFMANAYSPAMCPASSFYLEARLGRRDRSPRRPAGAQLPLVQRPQRFQATMLGHHAAVLDHADPGPRQLLGGAVVPDAELKPHGLRPPGQGQDLVRVARQIFGAPEHLDHVRGPGEITERRNGLGVMQPPACESGIDRTDLVAAAVQV